MRYFVIVLMFSSQVAFSQDLRFTSNNLGSANPFSLTLNFTSNSSNLNLPVNQNTFLPEMSRNSQTAYVSHVKPLVPSDFSFNGAPMSNGFSNVVLLGRTVAHSLNIGGVKANVRYVFDVNNNLIDHEFSIPLKKRKR